MTLFISYSSKDAAPVREVVRDLQLARFDVWLDQELRGGDPWWQDILRQIRECDAFIFTLSANSLASKPCRAELSYARALGLPVLPVQIGPVENLRATPVADIQVVDYRKRTADSGIALVAAVQDAVRQRGPLPDPLPVPPPVPFEYLLRLGVALEATTLTPEQQGDLLRQLRECIETEEDDGVLQDARGLLLALRKRPDVTHRSAMEIDALLSSSARPEPAHTTGSRAAAGAGGAGTGSAAEQPRQATAPSGATTREAVSPRPSGTGASPGGWYPDPHGSGQLRFWDGGQWTEHMRPQAAQSPVHARQGPRPAPGAGANGFSIAAFVLGAVAVLLFPIFLGAAAIVCAVVARTRSEPWANPALGVAITGTVLGVLLGAMFTSAYLY
jgi:hypothetical protein